MANHPKILGLIPARAGSEGIPGKHLKLLGGKPLIQYTIESALQSRYIANIALSTDCLEIIDFVNQYEKIEIPFLRPEHLSLADTPTLPVIQHVFKHFEDSGQQFDFVCLLQATTPFRCGKLIDSAIKFLLASGGESLVTVRETPLKFHPCWSFEMKADGTLTRLIPANEIIRRRQELPPTVYRDGQIYIMSAKMIKSGYLINDGTIGFLNDCGTDVNIDTAADWEQAERWLNNGK
jgi:CMP-N,N'-diacetyllegionaminic acid synthase